MDTVVLIINATAICVFVVLKLIQFKIHKKYPLKEPLRSLVVWNSIHNGAQLAVGVILRPQIHFSVRHFSITSSPNTWMPLPPELLHVILCIFFGVIAIRPVTNLLNYLKHKKHHDAKCFWMLVEILMTILAFLILTGIAYAEWEHDQSGMISVEKIGWAEGIQMTLTVGCMLVHLCISLFDSPIDTTYRPNIQPTEIATLQAYFTAVKWQMYITTTSICVPLGIPGVLYGLNLDGNDYMEFVKNLISFSIVLAPIFEEIVVLWIGRKDSKSNIAKVTVIVEREEEERGCIRKAIDFIITTMRTRSWHYIHGE